MNAAARVIHQSNVFTGHWFAMRLSQGQSVLVFATALLLLTAVAIAYVTNEVRLTLSDVEEQERQAHMLHLEWGQLLLEQASLVTPSRIEGIAQQKLGMRLPAEQMRLVLHRR